MINAQYLELERKYLELARIITVSHILIDLHISGCVFDQLMPPLRWYGVWPGCVAANTKLWEPVRVLMLPRIPSRYKSNCDHTVCIAYVPANLPVLRQTVGFTGQGLHRIKMFICGPR